MVRKGDPGYFTSLKQHYADKAEILPAVFNGGIEMTRFNGSAREADTGTS